MAECSTFYKVKDKVLLLIGRTGNGKSSTANSIIGKRLFGKKDEDVSLLQKYAVDIEGSKVTVVDGMGIGDTGSDMNEDLEDTIRKAETTVQLCESGFNALIFVMTYGTRFTQQDEDAVDLIKSLFGRDIFRRFGIIVMTRGDQFETDMEDDHKTFDQWCKEQTGDIKSLFQECEQKKVLFNNRLTNKKTLDKQRLDLLNLVSDAKKYSLKDFKLASSDRHKLLIKESFSKTEEENQLFLKDIDQQINRVNSIKNGQDILQNIRIDLETQLQKIPTVFEGSEYASLLLTPLEARLLKVETMIRQQGESNRKHGDDRADRKDKVNQSPGYRPMPSPHTWDLNQRPINIPIDDERERVKRPRPLPYPAYFLKGTDRYSKNGGFRENYDTVLPGSVIPVSSRTLEMVPGNERQRGGGLLELKADHRDQNYSNETKHIGTREITRNKRKRRVGVVEFNTDHLYKNYSNETKHIGTQEITRNERKKGVGISDLKTNRWEQTEPMTTHRHDHPEHTLTNVTVCSRHCTELETTRYVDRPSWQDIISRDTLDVESIDRPSYAFFLVGRSGTGKSSTGNSIFGKNVFITRKSQDSSDGDVICYHSALMDGRSMFVVDGTGIGDTGKEINSGVNEMLESVDFTMRNEMSKFNALILVHFIHERSQYKLKSSILAIKSILGPNVLKNWGIIVVTFGDLFDVTNLDENIHSFEDWCQQQTGYFQILLEECNNRCVLFDNKTTDKNKQMEQRNRLMSVVDSMSYKPYTRDDFDCPTCKLSRQQFILIEEVNLKIDSLERSTTKQYDANNHDIELLIKKLLEHKQRLTIHGQETEFTKQLLNQVTEALTKLQVKMVHGFREEDKKITDQFNGLCLINKEP